MLNPKTVVSFTRKISLRYIQLPVHPQSQLPFRIQSRRVNNKPFLGHRDVIQKSNCPQRQDRLVCHRITDQQILITRQPNGRIRSTIILPIHTGQRSPLEAPEGSAPGNPQPHIWPAPAH
jgi:hypothetical protein